MCERDGPWSTRPTGRSCRGASASSLRDQQDRRPARRQGARTVKRVPPHRRSAVLRSPARALSPRPLGSVHQPERDVAPLRPPMSIHPALPRAFDDNVAREWLFKRLSSIDCRPCRPLGLTGRGRRLVLDGDRHPLELFGRPFDQGRKSGLGFARSHGSLVGRRYDITSGYLRRSSLAQMTAHHDGS